MLFAPKQRGLTDRHNAEVISAARGSDEKIAVLQVLKYGEYVRSCALSDTDNEPFFTWIVNDSLQSAARTSEYIKSR